MHVHIDVSSNSKFWVNATLKARTCCASRKNTTTTLSFFYEKWHFFSLLWMTGQSVSRGQLKVYVQMVSLKKTQESKQTVGTHPT